VQRSANALANDAQAASELFTPPHRLEAAQIGSPEEARQREFLALERRRLAGRRLMTVRGISERAGSAALRYTAKQPVVFGAQL
jgi:hypothetical protein